MIKAAKRVLVFALWAQLIHTSSIEPRISLVDDLYLADEPAHQGQRTHITKLAKFPKMILSASSLGFRFFSQSKMAGQCVVERAGRCYLTTGRKSRMT